MKTVKLFRIIGISLSLMAPFGLSSETLTFEGGALEDLISTGGSLSVPAGDHYVLVFPDGAEVTLSSGSQFELVDTGGDIQVDMQTGIAVVKQPVGGTSDVTLLADGTEVVADGAEIVLEVDTRGSSVAQLGETGTMTVGGEAIPAGSGGLIGADGFAQSRAVEARLGARATQLLRSSSRPGPRPPYERMKPHPREIVRENLNDISPS